jgi:hypothetical protein
MEPVFIGERCSSISYRVSRTSLIFTEPDAQKAHVSCAYRLLEIATCHTLEELGVLRPRSEDLLMTDLFFSDLNNVLAQSSGLGRAFELQACGKGFGALDAFRATEGIFALTVCMPCLAVHLETLVYPSITPSSPSTTCLPSQSDYFHPEDRDVFWYCDSKIHYVVWNADCGTLLTNPDILVMQADERTDLDLWFRRILLDAGIAFGCHALDRTERTALQSAERSKGKNRVRRVALKLHTTEARHTRYNTPQFLP